MVCYTRHMGPSDRYYDPPDPVICCHLAEDEDDHDVEACLQDAAEEAAERKAESREWEGYWEY